MSKINAGAGGYQKQVVKAAGLSKKNDVHSYKTPAQREYEAKQKHYSEMIAQRENDAKIAQQKKAQRDHDAWVAQQEQIAQENIRLAEEAAKRERAERERAEQERADRERAEREMRLRQYNGGADDHNMAMNYQRQ